MTNTLPKDLSFSEAVDQIEAARKSLRKLKTDIFSLSSHDHEEEFITIEQALSAVKQLRQPSNKEAMEALEHIEWCITNPAALSEDAEAQELAFYWLRKLNKALAQPVCSVEELIAEYSFKVYPKARDLSNDTPFASVMRELNQRGLLRVKEKQDG